MKLSAGLVADQLQDVYPLQINTSLSLLPTLEHVYIYTEGIQYQPNTIYIRDQELTSAEDLVCPDSSLLILTGEASINGTACPSNVCQVLDIHVSPARILNTVLQILEKYNTWMSTLVNLRLSDSSIQAMLEVSYPIFHNPLMVMGMDFTIIAKVFPESSPFQNTIYGSQEETYRYVTAIKQDPLYSQVRERAGYFFYPNPASDVTSLCVNIKKYDVTSYRLMLMDYENPLKENTGFLLESLAELIEHALLHNTVRHTTRDSSLHSVFLHILSDRTADYVTISQKLDSLGWYSRNEYFCIVLQTSYMDQQNLTANAICTYVQSIIDNSCALPYKDNIVIYINMTKARMTIEKITEKINYFVKDSYLKAGYSRVMVGHLNLRRQYVQATLALDVGGRKHPFQWIHQFNDISFDYILEQSTKKLPGYMISHEKFLKLKNMDENGNSEYLKTLRVYLDNHLNAVQSARILYIHRSTFLYRLEKIKSVLETDFSDPNEILYLMLSFRFIDLENQMDEEPEEIDSENNNK